MSDLLPLSTRGAASFAAAAGSERFYPIIYRHIYSQTLYYLALQ